MGTPQSGRLLLTLLVAAALSLPLGPTAVSASETSAAAAAVASYNSYLGLPGDIMLQ